VRASIKALAQARLRAQKTTLTPTELVRGFRCLLHWGLVDLLNDVPFVPAKVLSGIADYPLIPRWQGDGAEPHTPPLPREAIEGGVVHLASFESLIEDEPGAAVHWVFAWQAGYTLIDADQLDPHHWVHGYVKCLEGAPFDLELVGPGKAVPFTAGRWLWNHTVRFCEAYRITIGEETVEVTDAGVYYRLEEDGEAASEILIPQEESSGRVVHQVTNFIDEYDHYLEQDAEEEEAVMQTFILAQRSPTPEAMLAAVLANARLRDYPALASRCYLVRIGDAGAVEVEAVP
jgi:hypothetical protein